MNSAVGWLARLMEFLKMMACDSGAKGTVNTPEDQGSANDLLKENFLSHQ